jgi:hypothetical protein
VTEAALAIRAAIDGAVLRALRQPVTTAAVARLIEHRDQLPTLQAGAVDALHAAVHATAPDQTALRRALLRAKRRAFNGLPVEVGPWLEDLAPPARSAVTHLISAVEAEGAEERRAEEADLRERSAARSAMWAVLDAEPAVLCSVALSDPSLVERVALEADRGSDGSSSRAERPLLLYLARAATRTAAYARFVEVSLAGRDVREPAEAMVNQVPLALRLHELVSGAAVAERTPVAVNPYLRRNDAGWTLVQATGVVTGSRRVATASVERAVLRGTPALDAVVELLSDRGSASVAAVADALSACSGEGRAAATAYVLGLLRAGVLVLGDLDGDLLRTLTTAEPEADRRVALAGLESLAASGLDGDDALRRAAAVRAAAVALDRVSPRAPGSADDWGPALYERPPVGPGAADDHVSTETVRDLGALADVLPLFDQRAVSRLLLDDMLTEPVDLLSFAMRALGEQGARLDGGWWSVFVPVDPPGAPAAVARWMQTLRDLYDEIARLLSVGDEEVELPAELLAAAAASTPAGAAVGWRRYSWVGQPSPAGFVVELVEGGHGEAAMRSTRHPEAVDAVRRRLRRDGQDAAELVEISGSFAFAGNVRPLVTERELLLPGDRPRAARRAPILLDEVEPTSSGPILRHREDGHELRLLYLGHVAVALTGPLHRTIAPLSGSFSARLPWAEVLHYRAPEVSDQVVAYPRLRHRSVVLSRRRWFLPAAEVARLAASCRLGVTAAVERERLVRRLGLPRRFYIRGAPSFTHKPQYFDCDSPLLCDALRSRLRSIPDAAMVEEALPDPGLLGPGERHRTLAVEVGPA